MAKKMSEADWVDVARVFYAVHQRRQAAAATQDPTPAPVECGEAGRRARKKPVEPQDDLKPG